MGRHPEKHNSGFQRKLESQLHSCLSPIPSFARTSFLVPKIYLRKRGRNIGSMVGRYVTPALLTEGSRITQFWE
ncbi:hypothetical protein V2G26_006238 [Clonostachys chloroleuca]